MLDGKVAVLLCCTGVRWLLTLNLSVSLSVKCQSVGDGVAAFDAEPDERGVEARGAFGDGGIGPAGDGDQVKPFLDVGVYGERSWHSRKGRGRSIPIRSASKLPTGFIF
jgi:hypothetical protein